MTGLITERPSDSTADRVVQDAARPPGDRRRPGRMAHVSPELVRLLRWRHPAETGVAATEGGSLRLPFQLRKFLVALAVSLLSWWTAVLLFRSLAASLVS